MKIMWFSRHTPLPAQIDELRRVFGEDVEIQQVPNPFADAREIVQIFEASGAREMVVVAPLSVISRLTELGIRPLWAKMDMIHGCGGGSCPDFDPRTDALEKQRHYRFVRFERIIEVRVVTEPLHALGVQAPTHTNMKGGK